MGQLMKRACILSLIVTACGCSHYSEIAVEPLFAIKIQDRNGLTETISSPERLEAYKGTDFLSSQPYKKVLRVYKKAGKTHSVITAYHPNGAIAQYLEAEEMRAHGAYKEWFPNGQQKIEAIVIGGTADIVPGAQRDWLFDGITRVWNEQGHLLAKIPYQKGVLQGTSTYYYSSGETQRQIQYI